MKKAIIIEAIVLLLIIGVGAYFFAERDALANLVAQRNKLETEFFKTKIKLNKEKEKLNAMKISVADSFAFAIEVQEQMKKSSDVVRKTNFMFSDSMGANAEFLVSQYYGSRKISMERRDINLLLEEWQRKLAAAYITSIDVEEAQNIKEEIEDIQAFIQNLTNAVGSFTTENSGLSQLQIEHYFSQLPSVETINQILVSLETAIQNEINANLAESGGTPSAPPIFPDEIVIQQEVVDDAEEEAANLQAQLDLLAEQIAQITPPVVPPSTPPAQNVSEESPEEYLGNTLRVTDPHAISEEDYQEIIIQPGPPRLIQGEDVY